MKTNRNLSGILLYDMGPRTAAEPLCRSGFTKPCHIYAVSKASGKTTEKHYARSFGWNVKKHAAAKWSVLKIPAKEEAESIFGYTFYCSLFLKSYRFEEWFGLRSSINKKPTQTQPPVRGRRFLLLFFISYFSCGLWWKKRYSQRVSSKNTAYL